MNAEADIQATARYMAGKTDAFAEGQERLKAAHRRGEHRARCENCPFCRLPVINVGMPVTVPGFGPGIVKGFSFCDRHGQQRDTYEQPEGPHSVKVGFPSKDGKDGTPYAGGYNTFAPEEIILP